MLARNALSVVFQTLVTVVTLFVLYWLLLKWLGSEQLGVWSLVTGSVSLSKLAELGLTGSVVKFIARYQAKGRPLFAAVAIETSALSVAALMLIVAPFACLGFRMVLHRLLHGELLYVADRMLPLSVISLCITSVAGVFLSGLDALQRFDLRALASCSSQVLYFALACLLARSQGLYGLAWAQVLQSLIVALISWGILRKQMPALRPIPLRWRKREFKKMLGYSTMFQANSLAQMLFEPTTKFLLARFDSIAGVAYYDMASRMVMQLRSLLVSASQVLVPAVSGMMEREPQSVPKVYLRTTEFMAFLGAIAFTSMLLGLPAIDVLWIGHLQYDFIFYAFALTVAWWFNAITAPAYQMYLGIGKLRWNSLGHAVMGIVNIALGATLGYWIHGYGVVVGTCISLTMGSLVSFIAFHREYDLPISSIMSDRTVRLYVLCALVLTVSAVAVSFVDWANASIGEIVFICVGFISAYLMLVGIVAHRHPAIGTLCRAVQQLWSGPLLI